MIREEVRLLAPEVRSFAAAAGKPFRRLVVLRCQFAGRRCLPRSDLLLHPLGQAPLRPSAAAIGLKGASAVIRLKGGAPPPPLRRDGAPLRRVRIDFKHSRRGRLQHGGRPWRNEFVRNQRRRRPPPRARCDIIARGGAWSTCQIKSQQSWPKDVEMTAVQFISERGVRRNAFVVASRVVVLSSVVVASRVVIVCLFESENFDLSLSLGDVTSGTRGGGKLFRVLYDDRGETINVESERIAFVPRWMRRRHG